MKKILVATDASENAQRALKSALEIARKFEAEIELLCVIPEVRTPILGSLADEIPPTVLAEEAERKLDATLKDVDTSGVTVTRKKIIGKAWKVIVKEAETEKVDLIAMGSHGYGAIVGSLLGSVSQNVLHGAPCSVLIVH